MLFLLNFCLRSFQVAPPLTFSISSIESCCMLSFCFIIVVPFQDLGFNCFYSFIYYVLLFFCLKQKFLSFCPFDNAKVRRFSEPNKFSQFFVWSCSDRQRVFGQSRGKGQIVVAKRHKKGLPSSRSIHQTVQIVALLDTTQYPSDCPRLVFRSL